MRDKDSILWSSNYEVPNETKKREGSCLPCLYGSYTPVVSVSISHSKHFLITIHSWPHLLVHADILLSCRLWY